MFFWSMARISTVIYHSKVFIFLLSISVLNWVVYEKYEYAKKNGDSNRPEFVIIFDLATPHVWIEQII